MNTIAAEAPVASSQDRISGAIDNCHAKFALGLITLSNFNELCDMAANDVRASLIEEFRKRVKALLRPGDQMVMVGEDHICVVFDELLDNNHVRLAGLKISRAFEFSWDSPMGAVDLDVYAGLIYAGRKTATTASAEQLYQLAKQTCARAIGEGSEFLVINAADQSSEDRDWLLNQRVSTAMEHHHLSMDYQPKIDLASGQLAGAEALVRWRDNGVIVPPDEYLSALNDETIWQLTIYTYRRVLRDILDYGLSVPVAINIDPSALANPEFTQMICTEATLWGIPHEQIVLEITENRSLFDIAQTTELLRALRDHGFKISLDDFGAGHSNMRRIRDLPLDELKLDRAICSDVLTNADSLQITRTIVELARALDLATVAEGIEDAENLEKLADLGVTLGQGFYLSAPLSVDDFSRL